MGVIRGLYMEDYPEQYKQYGQILERVWACSNSLSSLGELKLKSLDYTHSPEEAMDLLTEKGQDYDLFVADLLFHKDRSKRSGELAPDGLDAVHLAATEHKHIVIVAISVAEQESRFAGIKEKFLGLGGDVYFAKDWIRHYPDRDALYSNMGREIEGALRRKSRLMVPKDSIDLEYDRENYALQAGFETVGESRFGELVRQLAVDCVGFRVVHLDPGVSGASVYKVLGYNSRPFLGTARHIFMKVSHDRDALLTELKGVPPPGVLSAGVCPERLTDTPVEEQGWFAIAYTFLDDTATLHNWLLEQRPPDPEICVFLERLFEELRKLYASFRPEADRTPLDVLFPSTVFRARALASLKELWPLVQRHVTNQKLDSQTLIGFVKDGRIGDLMPQSIRPGVAVCDSHGDLHAKNILVGLRDKQPHLIDFSEREYKHSASDFAQLGASLLVRGWDEGIESDECANLERWRLVVDQWLCGEQADASSDDTNAAIWSCLTWVRDNYGKTMGGIHNYGATDWEFQLALAVEFIKLSGQLDVCRPKRALSLIAAHDTLSRLQSTIPTRREPPSI